jgi:D-serine deaminase-like pyridoxal phosphate-dependent protein
VAEYPGAVIERLSEEHGHVDCAASAARPGVGERVTVIPNHACVVSNLHDEVYGVRDGGRLVERTFRVAARGTVR